MHVLQNFGHKRGWNLQRNGAIRHVLEWVIRHQDSDGAWGVIQPPWIYSVMALYTEGYPVDHPVIARSIAALDTPAVAR